jgi:hypothetical protein
MDETTAVEKYNRLVAQRKRAVSNYYQKNKETIDAYNKSYYTIHKEELALRRKLKRQQQKKVQVE